MYSQDELRLHICAAHGASFVANGKDWLIRGGGRLLADLSAKSMFNTLLEPPSSATAAFQTIQAFKSYMGEASCRALVPRFP